RIAGMPSVPRTPALLLALILGGSASANGTFDAAREVLEAKCLSCHCPEKTKGDLLLTTRADLVAGGGSGSAFDAGAPANSELLRRVKLDEDDDEIMPPKGGPLSGSEIAALEAWLKDGAPWPEEIELAPRPETALPGWDAPPDPLIAAIEVFPKAITLESAADFHKPVVIARFDDAATHDITRQAKLELADPAVAKIAGGTLKPLQDGTTSLHVS